MAYLAGSILEENKARKFAFLIGFYSEIIFQFDTYFASTAATTAL